MHLARRTPSTRWRAIGATAVSVLALGVCGCTALRPVNAPGEYIESIRPKVVRITRSDGSQFLMVGARLENDTLMGFVAHKDEPVGVFEEMPFSDVSKLEAQQWASDRTVAAVTAGAVVWAGLSYLIIRHIEDTNP